ncbi:NADPH-dependent F420 reductase [Chitinimonas naiadis]
MTYSIIGAGKLGTALAQQFARKGIPVAIANSRGPESLTGLAATLGSTVTPQPLQEALKADIVILAIPFRAHAELARAVPHWNNRIVIDAMNTYGVSPEELGGEASSDVVAASLNAARVVKTFNQLPAGLLAKDPVQDGGRRVMFVWSRHEAASATVRELVDQLGFAPITLGSSTEAASMLELGGPLILQNLIKQA